MQFLKKTGGKNTNIILLFYKKKVTLEKLYCLVVEILLSDDVIENF